MVSNAEGDPEAGRGSAIENRKLRLRKQNVPADHNVPKENETFSGDASKARAKRKGSGEAEVGTGGPTSAKCQKLSAKSVISLLTQIYNAHYSTGNGDGKITRWK